MVGSDIQWTIFDFCPTFLFAGSRSEASGGDQSTSKPRIKTQDEVSFQTKSKSVAPEHLLLQQPRQVLRSACRKGARQGKCLHTLKGSSCLKVCKWCSGRSAHFPGSPTSASKCSCHQWDQDVWLVYNIQPKSSAAIEDVFSQTLFTNYGSDKPYASLSLK